MSPCCWLATHRCPAGTSAIECTVPPGKPLMGMNSLFCKYPSSPVVSAVVETQIFPLLSWNKETGGLPFRFPSDFSFPPRLPNRATCPFFHWFNPRAVPIQTLPSLDVRTDHATLFDKPCLAEIVGIA